MASGDYQATNMTRTATARIRELTLTGQEQLECATLDEEKLRELRFEAIMLKAHEAVALLSRAIVRLVRARDGFMCSDFIAGGVRSLRSYPVVDP